MPPSEVGFAANLLFLWTAKVLSNFPGHRQGPLSHRTYQRQGWLRQRGSGGVLVSLAPPVAQEPSVWHQAQFCAQWPNPVLLAAVEKNSVVSLSSEETGLVQVASFVVVAPTLH
jgi:hypothetical protein